jgi:hypothetical protein
MRNRSSVALLAVGCSLAVSACGGSSGGGAAGTTPSHPDAGIAFAGCMRAHGVPNFSDPAGGHGIQIPDGVDPASPAFKAARADCFKLLPGGGPPSGGTAQAKARMLATAECMRAHGVSGFPDPTASPPGNPAKFSIAVGFPHGPVLAVPKTIDINAPVFRQAAAVCHFG